MKLEDIDSNTELDMVSDLINNNYYKDTLNNIYNTSPKTKYKEYGNAKSPAEIETELEIKVKTTDTFIQNINLDIKLKRIYAYILLGLLCFQLISVNVIFILKGLKKIEYNNTSFNIFIAGALIEVIALVAIIIKYLFKDNINEPLKTIYNNKQD